MQLQGWGRVTDKAGTDNS